jgi:hypothetical protein
MVKKVAVAGIAVFASLALAAPAHAATRYYQQTVTGSTQAECEATGSQLAQQQMAQGYLVTWIGCGYSNFRWAGLVSWSD